METRGEGFVRTFVRVVAAGCVLHVVTGVGLPVSAAAVQQDREPGRCHEVRDVGALSEFGVELLRAVSGEGRENALVPPVGIGAVLASSPRCFGTGSMPVSSGWISRTWSQWDVSTPGWPPPRATPSPKWSPRSDRMRR